jgi:hypothetical protein
MQELVNKTWVKRNWKGPVQYEDKETRKLMMLPTDMVSAGLCAAYRTALQ